jgi:hypothetical protein
LERWFCSTATATTLIGSQRINHRIRSDVGREVIREKAEITAQPESDLFVFKRCF